ncbi:MAG: hypothetical protein HC851_23295 [Acaryochloris sp. RU_4_1]|nr:hypothetical protein [Acaryochloris sp. RU_4_1]NJR56956.1 hypothetical protein [Acaryochloris sp. CRU_2_0]
MSNLSFSKTLKTLEISKENLNQLCTICGFGESKEEFSDSEIETLQEVIQQRNQSGVESYTEAWQQLQAEVVPVDAKPVQKSDGTDNILEQAEHIADQDGQKVLQQLDGYGEDLQKAVLGAYMNRLNYIFEHAGVQRAVLEEPNELEKKSGPFTSRLNERLADQKDQVALPAASTISSTETLLTE